MRLIVVHIAIYRTLGKTFGESWRNGRSATSSMGPA